MRGEPRRHTDATEACLHWQASSGITRCRMAGPRGLVRSGYCARTPGAVSRCCCLRSYETSVAHTGTGGRETRSPYGIRAAGESYRGMSSRYQVSRRTAPRGCVRMSCGMTPAGRPAFASQGERFLRRADGQQALTVAEATEIPIRTTKRARRTQGMEDGWGHSGGGRDAWPLGNGTVVRGAASHLSSVRLLASRAVFQNTRAPTQRACVKSERRGAYLRGGHRIKHSR